MLASTRVCVFVLGVLSIVSMGANILGVSDKPRVAIWEVRATKAVEAQAASQGRSNELAQLVEAINASLPTTVSQTDRLDVVGRSDLALVVKEWDLIDFSGSVSRLDPQTAKSLNLAGAQFVLALQLTNFQDITQRSVLEGPLGKSQAERRMIQVEGVLKMYDSSTGLLTGSSRIAVSDAVTDETLPGVQQEGRPTNVLLSTIVTSLCGAAVEKAVVALVPAHGATSPDSPVPPTGTPARAEGPIRLAVFVKDLAPNVPDEKVRQLEDDLVASLVRPGISVIRREDVMNAVKHFASEGPNAGTPQSLDQQLDRLVSNSTSARNLAQQLGADGVCVASIDALDETALDWADPNGGPTLSGREFALRTTWEIFGGPRGETLASGTSSASRKVRANQQGQLVTNPVNELIGESAKAMGTAASTALASPSVRLSLVTPERDIRVGVFLADLYLPNVKRTTGGEFKVESGQVGLGPMGVTALVDGIAMGTVPGVVRMSEGMHTLRLERPGFESVERMINVREGLVLDIPMRMSTEGLDRWREESRFLEGLKDLDVLREVQIDKVRALVELMRRTNINVDTSNLRNLSVGADTIWWQLLEGN